MHAQSLHFIVFGLLRWFVLEKICDVYRVKNFLSYLTTSCTSDKSSTQITSTKLLPSRKENIEVIDTYTNDFFSRLVVKQEQVAKKIAL